MIKPIRFTVEDSEAAWKEWRFNCGPGALCAVLDMTPAEIRPHLGDFEAKGYTNIRLMTAILRGLQVGFRAVPDWPPDYGLVLVQWTGPWTRPGVPARAACRHTHWIGVRHRDGEREIFDINAVCIGGWVSWRAWSEQIVPWLLTEIEPKADGGWRLKKCLEIDLPE